MKKELAVSLKAQALEVARIMSSSSRAKNYGAETFELEEIQVTSEDTAAVTYLKKESGKRGVSFFYYIQTGNGGFWRDFFVTDSHILGMQAIGEIKARIEAQNFDRNFEDEFPKGEG